MAHTYLWLLLANEKCPEKMPLVTFLQWYVDNLNPENEKKSCELFWRKTDFKFPTYLMKAKNWSKSLKEVCERGVALTNDTNNFSSPYPL